MIPELVISVICALVSVGFCLFSIRQLTNEYFPLVKGFIEELEDLKKWRDDKDNTISRAYGILGTAGSESRTDNLVEKYFDQAVVKETLGIDPEELAGILEDFSPKLANLVKSNPETLVKLLPKIQQYIGMRKNLEGSDVKPSSLDEKSLSRIWSE